MRHGQQLQPGAPHLGGALSRTLASLQGGFSRSFNRRHRPSSPVWRSRYQTRLVDDQRYFDQLDVYIHLNPVRAGVVMDPSDHPLPGHCELAAAVGIGRWGQRSGELGRVLGKRPDAVSRWARMAAWRRAEDPTPAEQHEALDRALAATTSPGTGEEQ